MKMKRILLTAVFSGIILLTPMVSHAQIYQEADLNETMVQAQEIQRNNMTLYQNATGDRTQEYVVNGYLDSVNDVDWFKVDLKENQDNYLVFSPYNSTKNTTLIKIYDVQGNQISNVAYSAYGGRGTIKLFPTTSSGTFYVEVYSSNWEKKLNYRMSIGETTCLSDSYTYNFGRITLGPTNPQWSGIANFKNSNLPEGAIVNCVYMGGVVSSAFKSMAFQNDSVSWKDITLAGFDTPCTQQYNLKQNWQVRYIGGNSRDRSVSPQLTLYYIYPCTQENSAFWGFGWDN